MHEQCMQLNVWLLIEIQIENTLGLMNEKSNSLKSRSGGITFIIPSTKRPEIRLRNVSSTKCPTPIENRRCNGFVSAADNFRSHNALRFTSVPFRLEPNSRAKRTVF